MRKSIQYFSIFTFIKKRWYVHDYLLHVTGFVCALAFLGLAYSSQSYGDASLIDLLGVSAWVLTCTVCFLGYCVYKNIALPISHIIFWACVFRIIGVFSYPVLEDDHFRFLWDGYQFVSSGSPYVAAPAAFFDAELSDRFEDILSAINYPEVPTIYAPVTQSVFALAYLISPGQIWALKLLLVLFDVALLLLLAYGLKRITPIYVGSSSFISYQMLAFFLYAWSPLLIKETAFTGHPDIIGVFFMMAAIFWRDYNKSHTLLAWGGAAILCALAVGSKIFALILIPFVLQFCWRSWGVFIVSSAMLFLPFIEDLLNLYRSLQTMGESWLFNAPIYLVFNHVAAYFSGSMSIDFYLSGIALIKQVGVSVFVIFWLYYTCRFFGLHNGWRLGVQQLWFWVSHVCIVRSPITVRGDYLFGFFFLIIPALNPWYLIWLLPFAVLHPSVWAWAASFAILLSYIIGLNINDSNLMGYDQPVWAVIFEYSIIFFALYIDKTCIKRKNYLR
jgi:hypothetical protein